jgi:hypothetical protein
VDPHRRVHRDELTQLLFIFEHFDEIIGPEENNLYLGKWKTRWTAIEGARGYFDKITEELVDAARLPARSRRGSRPLLGEKFMAQQGGVYQGTMSSGFR